MMIACSCLRWCAPSKFLAKRPVEISEETRATHPGIPWRAIIGMRNRLIHAYFAINTAIVWQTVTQEIPVLLPQLRALATDE